jgi:hypothetical protein
MQTQMKMEFVTLKHQIDYDHVDSPSVSQDKPKNRSRSKASSTILDFDFSNDL